jgi:hypothetical protein
MWLGLEGIGFINGIREHKDIPHLFYHVNLQGKITIQESRNRPSQT